MKPEWTSFLHPVLQHQLFLQVGLIRAVTAQPTEIGLESKTYSQMPSQTPQGEGYSPALLCDRSLEGKHGLDLKVPLLRHLSKTNSFHGTETGSLRGPFMSSLILT